LPWPWPWSRSRTRAIYLTFDDGPNPTWTPPLLDALRDHSAFATFFLIDAYITAETAPIVRRIRAEGHAIGLHSGSRWPMVTEPEVLAAQFRPLCASGRVTTALRYVPNIANR
jgi:peptidoglycan/xylan/chitin deacetylase (PgdA/CDA1 family)